MVAQHSFAPTEQPDAARLDASGSSRCATRSRTSRAAPNVVDYAVRLVRATRPGDDSASPES